MHLILRLSLLLAAVKKSKKTMIMLKAKKAAVLGACSKLPWYKRWFNTIKGWFGSKITNCIKAAVKKSKKTMIELSRTTKKRNQFPSCESLGCTLDATKIDTWPAKCFRCMPSTDLAAVAKSAAPKDAKKDKKAAKKAKKATKKAALPSCAKLPWYKSWFNTIKGWF